MISSILLRLYTVWNEGMRHSVHYWQFHAQIVVAWHSSDAHMMLRQKIYSGLVDSFL